MRYSRERSRSLDPLRERDKWDKYKEQIRRAEETLDRALKFHEKNPEKHPAYPDEWKKFWNRRYKELQSEGKDPSKHDFKPEWIEFWNKRMRELHNEQIQQRKDEIRKRLELTDEKPPEKYSKSRRSRTPTSEKRKHRNESDDDVEYVGTKTIKQYHDRHEFRESRERDREYSSSYHYSRSSRPPPPSYSNYYRPPARPRYHATPYPVKDNKSPSPVADELPEDLEVVGLLRLLTALEDQLGSLGPKIISLLSKALAAEKLKPNSAEELLYDEEVSVLFETVKEKLKGQLFAGMIEKMAIPPTKSAIQNIARLLHKAAESKKKHEEEKKKKQDELMEMSQSLRMFMGLNRPAYARTSVEVAPKSEPVSVPGVGTVDKVAIAQQISVALIAQGRTDVTQEELETLINAVVGMAAASKNSEKPVTTADFVKGLTSSDAPAAVEPKEPSPPPVKPTPPPAPQVKPAPETIETKAAKMETLSDNELQSLLQNFKELNTEDQHALITFLKKLEATDPPRVEKLRAYVNLGPPSSSKARSPSPEAARSTKSSSPFSSRKGNTNPPEDDDKWKAKYNMFADDDEESEKTDEKKKMELSDDDDDDYSFEDIYKAADKNVSENEKKKKHSTSRSRSKSWSRSRSRSPLSHKSAETRNSDSNAILSETKRQIENIMRDLPTKFASKGHERVEPVVQPVQAPLVRPNVPVTVPTNYNQNYNPRSAAPAQQQTLPTPAQASHCTVYPNHSNQYPNYPVQQQPQQVQQPNIFNNTYHNGYGAYNQGYANMPAGQTQYNMQNQFPQQTFNDPYNGPANSAYHPNQGYGNYPQQSRFY